MKNLTFSGEVTYTMLDQKFAGTISPAAQFTTTAKPAAIYQLKDQDRCRGLSASSVTSDLRISSKT